MVVLEPNLSPHLYKFSKAEQMVQGGRDAHVTFRFTAEVNDFIFLVWSFTSMFGVTKCNLLQAFKFSQSCHKVHQAKMTTTHNNSVVQIFQITMQ